MSYVQKFLVDIAPLYLVQIYFLSFIKVSESHYYLPVYLFDEYFQFSFFDLNRQHCSATIL
jgi:hypothetical protein